MRTSIKISELSKVRLLILTRKLNIDQSDVLELIMRAMTLEELEDKIKYGMTVTDEEYRNKIIDELDAL